MHRTIPNESSHGETSISIDGKEIRVFSIPDPAEIPWDDLGVEIVVESSGRFTDKAKARKHLRSSVETVIISAPSKDADATFCMGVNENDYDPAQHKIISNASCTTNCLAPVAKVLHEHFGIDDGDHDHDPLVHERPGDPRPAAQRPPPRPRRGAVDDPHDYRRREGRRPGAAGAERKVRRHLRARPDAERLARRSHVPAPRSRPASRRSTRCCATPPNGELKGILAYSDEQLVSIDFNHNAHSSIVDTTFTRSVDPHMHKVLSWYDNEWGYSNRSST